ncbi:transposase for insertion sequence element IS231 [Bacillus thuringiensis serovar huazhongensis BGSC 4BD1]|nr:transposase for insertion sequence element IS231 [Bacillus thuringiensis serovar huazhongensis BGSC 4BD1]
MAESKVAITSLTQLCSRLEAYTRVLMSPEGLNKQYNTRAVKFLQHHYI